MTVKAIFVVLVFATVVWNIVVHHHDNYPQRVQPHPQEQPQPQPQQEQQPAPQQQQEEDRLSYEQQRMECLLSSSSSSTDNDHHFHKGELLNQFYVDQSQSWSYSDLFHPVQKVKNGGVGCVTRNRNRTRTRKNRQDKPGQKKVNPLTNTTDTTSTNNNIGRTRAKKKVVCIYSPKPTRAGLFPHTMQQLLRCYSLFRGYYYQVTVTKESQQQHVQQQKQQSDSDCQNSSFPSPSSSSPPSSLLLFPVELILSMRKIPNNYSATFVQFLQDVWNVTVVVNDPDDFGQDLIKVKVDMPSTETKMGDAYAFWHPYEDILELRSGFLEWMMNTTKMKAKMTSQQDHRRQTSQSFEDNIGSYMSSMSSTSAVIPRIGFLNRRWKGPTGHRHVLNHEVIMKELLQKFRPLYYKKSASAAAASSSSSNSHSGTVINRNLTKLRSDHDEVRVESISYLESFDGMTMTEQVEWMSNVDILVTPHGAQMTSLLFMPQRSCVVELFGVGLYVPQWYGSLSSSCNHTHMAVYTGNWTDLQSELHKYRGNRRNQARSKALCPNVPAILTAVEKMVMNWKDRRRRHS